MFCCVLVQDLIHGAPVGKPAASTAHVTAVYAESDSDEEIHFTRSIVGASSEFRINNKVCDAHIFC
jgi:structural maintenance of chromosome 1